MVRSLKWTAVDNLKKRAVIKSGSALAAAAAGRKGEEVSGKASAEVSVAHAGSSG